MWKSIVVYAQLDQPVGAVFAYLADPTLWHCFAPAVVMRRQLSMGRPGVGTRWAAIDRIGPFRFAFVDELAESVPNRRVVWLSSSPWNARTEYTCTDAGDGTTRVTARYEGDVSGWLRILSWAPACTIAFFLARDFKRLRAVLAGQQSAADGLTGAPRDLDALGSTD